MSENKQKGSYWRPEDGEEIVITGMSGKFPDARNVYELRDNLFNKVDMVSADFRRWKLEHPEIPQRSGKLFDIEKFDEGAFGIPKIHSDHMDTIIRLALEITVEAIVDAGHNPSDLWGTRTSVVVSECFTETHFESQIPSTDSFLGIQRSMLAKRISYHLGLTGPSVMVDAACTSSSYGIEQIYTLLKQGRCDKAILVGAQLCCQPFLTLQTMRLGVLSPDGKCKCFDDAADGYVRSEAVVAILVERAKDVNRIYAEIIHAKVNSNGFKKRGLTYPSTRGQSTLMNELYDECGIDPSTVTYVEAHGTGTAVGDSQELNAFDKVFCKNRDKPLPIGSVKSNIGHTESAAGICGLIKLLLTMEMSAIPPNLHYNKPKRGVEGLEKGRMKVVTGALPLPDDIGLFGLNGLGAGGANAHALFRWNKKTKSNKQEVDLDLPLIICVNGRVKEGITTILDDFRKRRCDGEYAYLINNVFRKPIANHLYRGYGIYNRQGEVKRSMRKSTIKKEYLALVFSDFNKNWLKLVPQLNSLPIFNRTMQRMQHILEETANINISTIFANLAKEEKDNQMLAMTLLQIAFATIFKEIKLIPHRIIGVGFGELVASYMDDSLTLRQTILELYCILYNSTDSNGNIIAKDTIATNKNSYRKWLSLNKNEVNGHPVQYFDDILNVPSNKRDLKELVKQNILTVIIGPDTMHVSKNKINFADANSENVVLDVLNNLGMIYERGFNMELNTLYSPIKLPVSRGTPMLSPLIKWNHNRDCHVDSFTERDKMQSQKAGQHLVSITTKTADWNFLLDYNVDGNNFFPLAGYLAMVWQCLALTLTKLTFDMKVVFEDVTCIKTVKVPEDGEYIDFSVIFWNDLEKFEVLHDDATVIKGKILQQLDELILTDLPTTGPDENNLYLMDECDIYKELKLRGYHYGEKFKSINKYDENRYHAIVEWKENWTTFLDCLFQLCFLQENTRTTYLPTHIEQLTIDASKIIKTASNSNNMVPVQVYKKLNLIKSPGIELKYVGVTAIPRMPNDKPVLEIWKFIAYSGLYKTSDSLTAIAQIILENINSLTFKVVEVCSQDQEENQLLCPMLQKALDNIPLVRKDMTILSNKTMHFDNIAVQDKCLRTQSKCLLLIVTGILESTEISEALRAIKDVKGFIISRESLNVDLSKFHHGPFAILCSHTNGNETLVLLRPKSETFASTQYFELTNAVNNLQWIPKLQELLKKNAKVVIHGGNEELNGFLGLMTCLKLEVSSNKVSCIFLLDEAPMFDPTLDFYKEQLEKNMTFNVWKEGSWGSYVRLPFSANQTIESEHCYLDIADTNNISTLTWLEGNLKIDQPLPEETALIHVYYGNIHSGDLVAASETYSPKQSLRGFGFSGRDSKGRRVMGASSNWSLSTLTLAANNEIFPIPDDWSMEDATTVPIVYTTVILALLTNSELVPGQSILIHSNAGGMDLAAINICLHFDLTVFVTVETTEKLDYIIRNYPQIKRDHIAHYKESSFEDMIDQYTKGKGVNYVLNSIGDKLLASTRCLAKGGRFIQIGDANLLKNNSFSLGLLEKEAEFVKVSINNLEIHDRQVINERLAKLILCGAIKPLPRTIFNMDKVQEAYANMSSSKHIGSVLIKVREEMEKIYATPKTLFKGIARFYCKPESSYLICGGLGGVGLELVDFLITRGAKKLILTSRSGLCNGYQRYRIKIWQNSGAIVQTCTSDASSSEGCMELLKTATALGPVDGIFNAAAVLKDIIFENQTVQNFAAVLAPKAHATKNLDSFSRKLCPNLRYFVVFSSGTSGRGNVGQTNYGMANSVMERICERRKLEGYPALAIQWGAIGDVGIVSQMKRTDKDIVIGGTLQQPITSCLETLELFLNQSEPVVSSMRIKKSDEETSSNLFDAVLNILGIKNVSSLSMHSTLPRLGMDSMHVVEIKLLLENDYEVILSELEIREMTLLKLKNLATIKVDS